jgi:hypothetical protein
MKRISVFIKAIFFVAITVFFQGCATEPASLKIESGLPPSKFAYYNDTFDKLREDLWDKAGYMHSEPVRANFRQANMVIKDGKLRIDTQTGSFSKGGLASRYVIRGDFDIQIDCHIDFLNGFQDMDQVVFFGVLDRGSEIGQIDSVNIGLAKRGNQWFKSVFSGHTQKGKYRLSKYNRVGDFNGTLRIVRIENNISTLYKIQGEREWRKLGTFRSTLSDIQLGFKLQNYTHDRTSITAKSPVTATFENFKINAAQEIIEEDI